MCAPRQALQDENGSRIGRGGCIGGGRFSFGFSFERYRGPPIAASTGDRPVSSVRTGQVFAKWPHPPHSRHWRVCVVDRGTRARSAIFEASGATLSSTCLTSLSMASQTKSKSLSWRSSGFGPGSVCWLVRVSSGTPRSNEPSSNITSTCGYVLLLVAFPCAPGSFAACTV